MVRFWMEVWSKAIVGTFGAIGRDPADFRFSIIVLVVLIIAVFVHDGSENGWRGMKGRIRKLLTRDAIYIGALCLVVFVYQFVKAPYSMWRDQEAAVDEAVNGKDGRLEAWSKYHECDKERAVKSTLADSCTSNLAFQQSRNDGQQDLFNKCMLAMGLRSKPEPARVQMRYTSFDTPTKADGGKPIRLWLIVAVVDKSTSPFRGTLTCDKTTRIFGGRPAFAEHVDALSIGPYPVGNDSWRVQYTDPSTWTPDTPLIFTALQVENPTCRFVLN
jgi:hypothetical protein